MIIGVIVLLILIFYVSGRIATRQKNAALRAKLIRDFGILPEQTYQASDFERIRKYYDKKKTAGDPAETFHIDDMTWNDLNMNDIFALFNATQSSVGEEYLYERMHRMELKETKRFASLTDYFQTHEQERVNAQISLHGLSKITHFSVTDILDRIAGLERERNLKHFVLDVLLLLSIALIFFYPGPGILLAIIFLAYSVISYFGRKGEIEPFYTTFFYVVRLLRCADEILSMSDEVAGEDKEDLIRIANTCRPFRRNAYFLASGVHLTENIFEIILDYIRIIFHIDIIKFNSMLEFLQEHTEEIDTLREALGQIDAAIGVANAMKAIPGLTRPGFWENKELSVTDAFHPLLKKPVSNSITTKGGVLITGSNASGKSTFIKTVALCALLAQTLYVVPAASYRSCRVRLCTSMALADRIKENESYFIVEIKSLKRIADLSETQGAPVLCFIDEVLRGTNTVERIAASSRILSELNKKNAICFAATHDMELTQILQNEFTNYHFDEEVHDRDVTFSYRLKEGGSDTRNAILLLSLIGFDEKVVKEAESAADHFTQTRQWGTI